ncbi:MAG: hypothetical protein ACLP4R_13570 [Solirubrobacteraceae bacterium]
MSESTLPRSSETSNRAPAWGDIGMLVLRYGIGIAMVLGGLVVLITSPADLGVDGFAMAAGGGLSVLLLNFMYRLSLTSERDRLEEERARRYFDEHGEWPEEEERIPGRKWTLPAGAVMANGELVRCGIAAPGTTGGSPAP